MEWEHVSESLVPDCQTHRMRVPGGWIYREVLNRKTRAASVALVFVPLSNENLPGDSDE